MITPRIAVWISGICGSLLAIALTVGDLAAQAPIGTAAKLEAKDLFGTAKVWTIDLEVSATEYEAMQPAAPVFPGGPPQPKVKKDKRPTEQNRFGTAFPWAHASIAVNGTKLDKVGIRYAGERADAIVIREPSGVCRELARADVESRTMLKISAMPEGLAANLTPAQLADLLAYLQSLESR